MMEKEDPEHFYTLWDLICVQGLFHSSILNRHVYPWLIHVNVWQKPLKYCKVISLQLIKKKYSIDSWDVTGAGAAACC